jgi:hypothetical protein
MNFEMPPHILTALNAAMFVLNVAAYFLLFRLAKRENRRVAALARQVRMAAQQAGLESIEGVAHA